MLVARNDEDPRFQSEKFEVAPAVFPNNDIKYEVNKLRAQMYAQQQKKEEYIVLLKTLLVQKHCVYVQTFLLKKYLG